MDRIGESNDDGRKPRVVGHAAASGRNAGVTHGRWTAASGRAGMEADDGSTLPNGKCGPFAPADHTGTERGYRQDDAVERILLARLDHHSPFFTGLNVFAVLANGMIYPALRQSCFSPVFSLSEKSLHGERQIAQPAAQGRASR